jgi:ATP-dependent protease ClpP protease subunit
MLQKFLVLMATMFTTTAFAGTFKVNNKRRIDVVGEVGRNVIPLANQIDAMAKIGSDPIDLVINSPGGSVVSGLVFLSAMKVAQSRGVKFRCVTTLMSASMAFFFLANCDERYAFENAYLLWHPISMTYGDGQRSDTLIHDGKWMDGIEALMIREILPALDIPFGLYMYHRNHETLWTAKLLEQTAPKFLVLVDDVIGLDRPFSMDPPQQ